jgi:hypothetical protein
MIWKGAVFRFQLKALRILTSLNATAYPGRSFYVPPLFIERGNNADSFF